MDEKIKEELDSKIETIYVELLHKIVKETHSVPFKEHYVMDKLISYLQSYNNNHFNH